VSAHGGLGRNLPIRKNRRSAPSPHFYNSKPKPLKTDCFLTTTSTSLSHAKHGMSRCEASLHTDSA
jgi:hypothetical protein